MRNTTRENTNRKIQLGRYKSEIQNRKNTNLEIQMKNTIRETQIRKYKSDDQIG